MVDPKLRLPNPTGTWRLTVTRSFGMTGQMGIVSKTAGGCFLLQKKQQNPLYKKRTSCDITYLSCQAVLPCTMVKRSVFLAHRSNFACIPKDIED